MFARSLFQRSATILLVEDEQDVLETMHYILRSEGYYVLRAHSPKAALQIGSRHDYAIDLLLTEATLPGLYGWELAELMKLDYPKLRVLYITGGCRGDVQELIDASELFLRRPFRNHHLVRAVRKALDERVVKGEPGW
jgi:DNA-binding NtrC family response regulator